MQVAADPHPPESPPAVLCCVASLPQRPDSCSPRVYIQLPAPRLSAAAAACGQAGGGAVHYLFGCGDNAYQGTRLCCQIVATHTKDSPELITAALAAGVRLQPPVFPAPPLSHNHVLAPPRADSSERSGLQDHHDLVLSLAAVMSRLPQVSSPAPPRATRACRRSRIFGA